MSASSSSSQAHLALDAALRKRGVYDRAREVLREYAASSLGGSPALPDALPTDVFDALSQAGLVDTLLNAAREEGISLDAATFDLLRRGGGGGTATATAAPSGDAPDSGFDTENTPATNTTSTSPPLDPNRRYIRVSLGRGRAFLAHLEPGLSWRGLDSDEDEDEKGEGGSVALDRFYLLHVCVAGQRFRSAPVRATVEPAFDGSSSRAAGACSGFGDFLIDVTPEGSPAASLPSLSALLTAGGRGGATAHFVLVLVAHRQAVSAGGEGGGAGSGGVGVGVGALVRSDVVGSGLLDWRGALSEPDGIVTKLLLMMPPGPVPSLPSATSATRSAASASLTAEKSNLPLSFSSDAASLSDVTPVGLLPITLALLPAPGGGCLARTHVAKALAAEAAKDADAASAFLAYAQAWWAEYRSVHSSFRRRLVRIFGEGGEAGGRFVPVVSRVAPIYAHRLLESPGAAARFVSLLPARRDDADTAVGGPAAGGGASAWRAPHAVLAARAGSVRDRAVLLCGLLLGFGLDAYVVVGTRDVDVLANGVEDVGSNTGSSASEEEHAWVLTRYTSASAAGGGVPATSASSFGSHHRVAALSPQPRSVPRRA